MVIFWNFAGVPFVCPDSNFLYLQRPHIPFLVLRLLCGLYGIARSFQVQIFNSHICHLVHHFVHRILHVSRIKFFARPFSFFGFPAGIPLWLKKVISKCRLRVSTRSEKHSLSFLETRSRTLLTFKLHMGNYADSAWAL